MRTTRTTVRPGALCAVIPFCVLLLTAGSTPLPSPEEECDCEIEVGPNDTLTIDTDRSTDCVCVHRGGTLNIAPGVTLTVSGAGGNTTSTIDGTINLQGSESELAFTENHHELTGSGQIVGEHNDAEITTAGVTLTSAITIEGALTMQAASTRSQLAGADFVNNGLVEANRANETLTIYNGTVQGSCDGEFKVATSNAALWFRSAVGDIDETNMGCTFTQSAGTFDIDINIDTRGPCSGTFDVTHGSLDCCQGEDPCPGCQ
jgi:hypothetical protein